MGCSSSTRNQFFAALSANLLTLSYGASFGWISSSYLQLQDPQTSRLTLGTLTKDDLGWVTSSLSPGGLFGVLFFGWLADKIGRKRCLLLMAVPIVLHWLLIATATNLIQLCVARFLAGAAGGCGLTVIPIYITELAEDRLRSTLGTISFLSFCSGLLLINVLGYLFHYVTVACIMIALPLVFATCFAFKPDTPQYLEQRNRREAERSLKYYRGIPSKESLNEELQLELTRLCKSTQQMHVGSDNNSFSWSDFINLISLSYGGVICWTSASYIYLKEDSNHFETGVLTNEQLGLITAALSPGSLAGAFFFGWLADKIGRKRCLLFTALPMLAHWLIICFARNPWQLAVARFLGGTIGGSSYTVISIYITEIAQDSLRSTLGMITSLALASGYLLINTLGYFLHYITVAWIMTIIPLAFLVLFAFNPESPHYLAQRNRKKAERSLRYYRGISSSSDANEEFQQELSRLCQSEDEKPRKLQLCWHDFTNRKARKAYFIGLGLILTNQFNGCLTMQNYMTFIFAEAGSNLPPMLSAIIVSAIILLGTFLSTNFAGHAGRKTLLLGSISGIFLGESIMASYYYLTSKGYETSMFNWLPIATFSLVQFSSTFGIWSVTVPLIAELTPPKIRSIVVRVQIVTMFLLSSVIAKIFPQLCEALGMPIVFFIFSGFSFIFIVFIAIFVPETKGKSIQAIQDSL
ncbi:facilitated trehalose transporter Tret1-2 homolog isoform X2 [Drosophila albomicans]|uniref:Facilitated trehalose transporter Tret1-2 homolog isoform X2 n=1 Tax=Drosophila albomicans TaxID=7291 RepID=A0A9C6ST17_DROAB|nr:facilitated trehalose transporter Tret1-2 homolog isoform X2 [Drosophila albomicans]